MKGFYDETERTVRPTKPYVKFSCHFAACTPSKSAERFRNINMLTETDRRLEKLKVINYTFVFLNIF